MYDSFSRCVRQVSHSVLRFKKIRAKAGNIVGAIANEAGIDAENIGKIKLFESHSTVDLPEGMPKPIFKTLKKVWVANQQLNISKLKEPGKQRSKRSR